MKTSSVWTSLRSAISNLKERSSSKKNKANANALSNKLNLNEEYQAAFRTNSYVEFTATNNNTSSSSSLMSCLLQPDQDMLHNITSNGGHVHNHDLLIQYFQASFEAFETCRLLLQALNQTKINHHILVNATIKLTAMALRAEDDDNGNHGLVYGEDDRLISLSSFSHLKDPNFSILTRIGGRFLALHESHSELLQKLASKRNETRSKLRLKRLRKRAAKGCLLISNAAVLVALLLLALHSLVGIVAAPGLLIACFVGLLKKKVKRDYKLPFTLETSLQQMEIAARGTYITMNDLDTLSRMAARLDVEVEHLRAVGEMWMRSSRSGCEILKEFVVEDEAIVEQMKELQQHIYLCFHTINRSRRLVMNEIMGDMDQSG
ncbi:hypothetical protein IC582_006086 [Cucumis melo]